MVLNEIVEFWDSHGDPRTSQWFLTKNLYPIFGIILGYLIVVLALLKIFGGKKHQKYEIVLAFYYFLHSAASFFFIALIFVVEGHDLRCKKLIQNFDPLPMFEVTWVYYWLWLKISEVIQTFLMIICNGKVHGFNVVHHSMHPLFIVIFLHFHPGGPFIYYGLINNIQHAVLYFIVPLRIISRKFKEKSDKWFPEFYIIVGIICMVLPLIHFSFIKTGGNCTPFFIKITGMIAIGFGLIVLIIGKWRYISKDEAFGHSKLVKWINRNEQRSK